MNSTFFFKYRPTRHLSEYVWPERWAFWTMLTFRLKVVNTYKLLWSMASHMPPFYSGRMRTNYSHWWVYGGLDQQGKSLLVNKASDQLLTVLPVNSLRLRQDGCHFVDDVFTCILLNENFWISNNFSLKCVPWCVIDNMQSLVQIKAWRRIGGKPLSESMMV